MARIRTFKPAVFDHEELCDLENQRPELRPIAVFLGLMCCADKAGRFVWSPRKLKLTVMPFVDYDLAASMEVLSEHDFLRRYEVDRRAYGYFPTWAAHQRPHHQEPQSILPTPPKDFGDYPKPFTQDHNPPAKPVRESLSGTREALNGREGKGREKEGEKEGKQEGEGSIAPPAPAAAWTLDLPLWVERELQALGLSLRSARELLQQVGRDGLAPALAKLRSKGTKGENPAGLLLRRGTELSEEGRAMLTKTLDRAKRQAPLALEEPDWTKQPVELREDPEVAAAWCIYRASEGSLVTTDNRIEMATLQGQARGVFLHLALTRHPDGDALRAQADANVQAAPATMRNRMQEGAAMRLLGITPMPTTGGF